jgi:hypothetical protein
MLFAGVAQAQSWPDIVPPPKALNLGSTSFFDGFGRTEQGWSILQYGRYENFSSITDSEGRASPYFKGTSIQVFSELTQIAYTTDWHPFGGDAVGFSASVPLVKLATSFAADSPVKLSNNGFGIGDLVWGPLYQSRVFKHGGRPVLSFRVQLMILSPTGDFNPWDNINQSAGFWALNPYVAITWLPTPKLEFTTRLNYQYNFATNHFADPPPVPGLSYVSGQAAQIVYGNFDASYQVAERIRLGFNGYFIQSLNDDRTNGHPVPQSEVTGISAGPGGRYTLDKSNALNVNLYLPIESRNGSRGPQFNFQFIHRF